jgi:mannose-1-phosphate guanylyltransferase
MTAEPWILLLAGGAGTRFWPASRREEPKHVLPLLEGGRSLLQETLLRVKELTSPERVFVVTAADQVERTLTEIDGFLSGDQLIIEPEARNTAPAIALSMVTLSLKGAKPHDPVMVLPCDAWVDDVEGLRTALKRAAVAAVQHKAIVTLGVPPTAPSTGYGYLGLGEEEETDGEGLVVRKVLKFTEKPDQRTARQYTESGNYWWNAGIFVFRLGYLWYVMGDLRDDFDVGMALMGGCVQQDDRGGLAEEYAKLEAISIDYCVMQDAPSVLTVPLDVGWSDLGSWDAVAPLLADVEGGLGRADIVLADGAKDNLVFAPGKAVGLVGVSGLAVVATDDAILVVPRERAQEVRALVAKLKEQGREDLT